MKRILKVLYCVALFSVLHSPFSTLQAQTIRYESDSTCGCDIVYVNGIETLRDGDLYGFRREDGTVIVPPRYLYVGQFDHGWCRVSMGDGLIGLIDSNGREAVPCLYDIVDYPSDGRIHVAKDGLQGFTNLNGQLVIPLQQANFSPFSEGLAAAIVLVDSFFTAGTYIDTTGRQVFTPQFDGVRPFVGGHAAVSRNNRWGLTTEVLFARRGAYNNSGDPYSANIKLDYVDIPVLLHFQDPYGGMLFGLGLCYGRLVQQPHFQGKYNPNYFVPDTSDYSFSHDDFAVVADARFTVWRGLQFNIRWQYSLLPVKRDWQFSEYKQGRWYSWSNNCYNHSLLFRLIYQF